MKKIALLLACSVFTSPALAGPAQDATSAVTTVIDKFNGGDINAFFAAHEPSATISDEIPPFFWTGPNAVQRWAADYAKDAKARGITGGHVDYGRPLQAESSGGSAYVVLPTTYRFVQNGKKMAGKGSMTFVMHRVGATWKIGSWTYAGATATPE